MENMNEKVAAIIANIDPENGTEHMFNPKNGRIIKSSERSSEATGPWLFLDEDWYPTFSKNNEYIGSNLDFYGFKPVDYFTTWK